MSLSNTNSDNKKRNLLWQIDYLEAQLNQSVQNTRLKSTKKAAEYEIRRRRRQEKATARKRREEEEANGEVYDEDDTQAQEEAEVFKKELRKQISGLKRQLVEQKVHHGIVQMQRLLKKGKTMELLKVRKNLKRNRANNTPKEGESAKELEKRKQQREKELVQKLEELKIIETAELAKVIITRRLQDTYIYKRDNEQAENKQSSQDQDKEIPDWIPESILPTKGSSSSDIDSDLLQQFGKLASVEEFLEELVGIINHAVGIGSKVKREGDKEEDSEDDSEEGDKEDDSEDDGEEGSINQELDEETLAELEANSRKLAFSDDESDEEDNSNDKLEELKSSKKVVTNSSSLNYDDISDSEGGDEDEDEDEDDEDDDDNEEEEDEDEDDQGDFFENFDEKRNDTPETTKPKKEKTDKKPKKEQKKIVLPALMSTFIAPDASEAAELEQELKEMARENNETKSGKIQLKNRPGQRARRALAERKFGRQANHLKLEKEKQKADYAKRQIEYEAREAKRRKLGKSKDQQQQKKEQETRIKQEEQKKLDSLPLHPSWEAKKKLNAAPVKFVGKKITFD